MRNNFLVLFLTVSAGVLLLGTGIPSHRLMNSVLFDRTLIMKEERSCGTNQQYTTCGTACPTTCDNKDDTEPRPCILMCVEGCECLPGFVLDRTGNNCIDPKEC